MFWFVVLLLIVGGCFFLYHRMVEIEKEIRAGQDVVKTPPVQKPIRDEEGSGPIAPPPVVTAEVGNLAAKAEPVEDEALSLEDEVLSAVVNLPGMKQTELYDGFADVSRKKLQQMLKEMDDAGQIRREKKGSSYLLYPV